MTQKTARTDTIEYTESTTPIAILAYMDQYDRTMAKMATQATPATDAQKTTIALCQTRDDDKTLIEMLHAGARNAHYRSGQTIATDDAFQTMVEWTIEQMQEDPTILDQTTSYIVTGAYWAARRQAKKNATHDRRFAAFQLDATGADGRPQWETIGADSQATIGMESANLAIDLRQALQAIDRRQATAIAMRELYDMDYTAIADAMQTTPANVRQLVRRGRQALRQALPLRKPAPKNWTTLTAFRFAGLDRELYTQAKTTTGRIVRSIARTENRYRFDITYGNGQTETIGHRSAILVAMKTDDDLITTPATEDRKIRTTDRSAPPATQATKPDRPSYQDVYTHEDLIAGATTTIAPMTGHADGLRMADRRPRRRRTLADHLAEMATIAE